MLGEISNLLTTESRQTTVGTMVSDSFEGHFEVHVVIRLRRAISTQSVIRSNVNNWSVHWIRNRGHS